MTKSSNELKTKLQKQTNSTTDFSLSSRSACAIIEVCAARGVSVLKFGPLYVEFGMKASSPPAPAPEGYFAPRIPVEEMTDQAHDKQTQDSVEAEEVNLREERLQQMFIEDPVRAEELLRNGELEDADDESEHDE